MRAFRVLVRNALFHRVELIAARRWHELGELDADDGWTLDRWFEAMAPYFAEYDHLGIDVEGLSRAVIVQPSAYGFDNSCTLDAVAQLGESGRGIALVARSVEEAVRGVA